MYSCISSKVEVCKTGVAENQYDFLNDIRRVPNLDYFNAIIEFRQFGSYSKNNWIRKPNNLNLVYGCIKGIGIDKFISHEEFNQPMFTDHWAESCWEVKSLNEISKNLITSYTDTTGFDNYYIEFWSRRRHENNAEDVLKVLKDINEYYNNVDTNEIIKWTSDTTLKSILEYEIALKEADSTEIKSTNIAYANYLRSIGLHSSANNLIHYANELQYNQSQAWDKEYLSIIQKIETDSSDCDKYRNWRQSAEWFSETYDYGP